MRIGHGTNLYISRRWRWIPDAGIGRMNRSFAGGFHFYWLCFALSYDHLTERWYAVKHAID